MPASQENSLNIDRLGIIAGSGSMPQRLAHACEARGIEPFIIAFEGHTDQETTQGRNHLWTRLGASGHVIKTLKKHNVKDLVMIGPIRRPSLSEMIPDLKTIEFFTKISFKALGDNDFLKAVRTMLEEEGFTIHGVHKFIDDMLAQKGSIGKYAPKNDDWVDINRGIEVARALGSLDVGQSVIVQQDFVLGVEAVEGTDELMRRCKALRRKGRGGVLVKTCKPQQDRDLDLPTIGPDTVVLAVETGLAGIALEAGQCLVIDADKVAEEADKNKIFVIGIDPKTT